MESRGFPFALKSALGKDRARACLNFFFVVADGSTDVLNSTYRLFMHEIISSMNLSSISMGSSLKSVWSVILGDIDRAKEARQYCFSVRPY